MNITLLFQIYFLYLVFMATMEEELLPFVQNISSYSGDNFYKFVKEFIGPIECEIFEIQYIKNVRILLRIPDVFSFFRINSKATFDLKRRACFIVDNDNYVVRAGIRSNIEQFIDLLKNVHGSKSTDVLSSDQKTTSIEVKQMGHCTCDRININKENKGFQSRSFAHIFVSNLLNNMEQSSNNYHFDIIVNKFASALNILVGHNAYEFIRLNLPGALPSTTSLRNYNQSISLPLRECEFRFGALKNYLDSIGSNYVFMVCLS